MFEIKENFPLKNYNSFGIDINTRFFVECNSVDELIGFLNIHRKTNLPLMILGGGSNVLFTKDFEGYIVRPGIRGIEILEETETNVTLRAGAGEDWDAFVAYCVEHGWGGIENLSLIPGNVGTCPIQNIGAYGVEVKDVITKVETVEISSLKIHVFENEACQFGYRDSIFKRKLKGKHIITHVSFQLKKQPDFKLDYGNLRTQLQSCKNITLNSIRNAVIDIRETKLPKPEEIGNAGSFFKNPIISQEDFERLKEKFSDIPFYSLETGQVKIPAGWLIENTGWKGKRLGNVGVHHKQALVLVNLGNAKGNDVIKLAVEIQRSVKDKFGIELEMEVNVV